MPTSAVLNVGVLNDFKLNVTTAASATVETDGSDDHMALDAYVQRQNQYQSITTDFHLSVGGRQFPWVVATPRSNKYTLFVQRVVYIPSEVPAADTVMSVHNGATPIRYALRATIPMAVSTTKGMQPFIADYGPNGMSMGEGNSLLLETPGPPSLLGILHVEGYQRHTQTMAADAREAAAPRVVAITLRPDPVLIGVSGRIGCVVTYDQPLLYGPNPLPCAIEMTSVDLGSYPSIGMNMYGGPFNTFELINGGRDIWFFADMNTTGFTGRIYKVTDQGWRQGWSSFRSAESLTRVLDNFNGVTGLLKV